jgi:hypothetical protein
MPVRTLSRHAPHAATSITINNDTTTSMPLLYVLPEDRPGLPLLEAQVLAKDIARLEDGANIPA